VSAGIKIAKHHHLNEVIDPDSYERAVSGADENAIRAALADHLPAANGRLIDAKTCLYTMTPDSDFLIDRVAGAEQIIVASPCSGHGFKFAPVMAEILADLASEGETRHDIRRFRLNRFG
jgi:sarcosine oxidase